MQVREEEDMARARTQRRPLRIVGRTQIVHQAADAELRVRKARFAGVGRTTGVDRVAVVVAGNASATAVHSIGAAATAATAATSAAAADSTLRIARRMLAS